MNASNFPFVTVGLNNGGRYLTIQIYFGGEIRNFVHTNDNTTVDLFKRIYLIHKSFALLR